VLGAVVGVVAAGLLALIVGAPLTLAHRNNLPLERWYGDVAVDLAARSGAASVPAAPASLVNDRRAVQAGMYAFTGSCAVCHNANGDGKGAFGQGTYPPATDLTSHDAKEKSDASLFWIIKNGLSFTGMPAFGHQYSDQDIWSLVAYIRTLQRGTQTQISFVVPTPTAEQLALADPSVDDPVHRGATIYFGQGCASCHGATGNGPGEMALRGFQARETAEAVRQGRRGMPRYGPDQISDSQISDLAAYIGTFGGAPGRPGGPGAAGGPGGSGNSGGLGSSGGPPGGVGRSG
jgi:mono/diheme cytochrome c family protein